MTDINVDLMRPDPVLFPNTPSGVKVHSGFAIEHRKTAPQILREVKRLMAEDSSTHVILVGLHLNSRIPNRTECVITYQIGHSLGGALAELDTLFMKLNLPAGTTVHGVTFGTPRVGNAAWATFFDSRIADFTRMNNNCDIIPIVPGRLLGFRHPSGEIHIEKDGSAIVCLGE